MPATAMSPPPEACARRVAYVMNGFPRLSETFIAHEIHQLERLGLALRLFVVKREDEPAVHPVVAAIQAPLVHLPPVGSLSGTPLLAWLRRNAGAYAAAHGRLLRAHPWRWLSTAALALGHALAHRTRDAAGRQRLRKVYVKEFLQAGHVADAVRRAGDVDHLHGHFCHGVATITWFAARLAGLPFSFTAHAKDLYQAELNPGRLLERKLAAARFVVTCTCANAQVLRARHPRPGEVHTVYHGLDTDWFSPRPRAGAPVAAPLLLAVGRHVEKKGFDTLLDACAQLQARGLDFRCWIVGENGSATAALQAQIRQQGLGERVQLHGPLPQDRLRELYRQAHAFALPCQVMADGDRDGFPNVLAEAMAMGVPVVSTRISGIPEMIDDGLHGLLVEPRDAAALAAALEQLLVDPGLHLRLAVAARARICERFDSRRTTEALHTLFSSQLRPAGQGRLAAPTQGAEASA